MIERVNKKQERERERERERKKERERKDWTFVAMSILLRRNLERT